MANQIILYQDIDFVLKKQTRTGFNMLMEDDAINQSIGNILSTTKGERLWDPRFGCNLNRYLFEKITPLTSSLIKNDIRYALENYEPRINIKNITVDDDEENHQYTINLEYEIVQLGRSGTTTIILRVL